MHPFLLQPHATLLELFAAQGQHVHFRIDDRHFQLFVDPNHISAILGHQSEDFVEADLYQALARRIGSELDAEPYPRELDLWHEQRTAIEPLFNQAALAGYEAALTQHVQAAIARWDAAIVEEEGVVDVIGDGRRFVLEFVLAELLGVDPSSYAGFNDLLGLLSMLEDTFDLPTHLGFRAQPRLDASLARLAELLDELIARQLARGDERDDFITLLARTESICEGNPAQARAALREGVATLLFESVGPTASALFWVLQRLASKPYVLQQVLARLDQPGKNGNGVRPPVDLDSTIYETLRIHPPLWLITRVARVDTQIGSHPVAAGTTVLVSAYVTHRDPQSWPDPEAFRPERFKGYGPAAFRTFAFLPFGQGRRTCLGARLVLRMLELLLPAILQRYQIESTWPGPLALTNTLALLPRKMVSFTFAPRS